MGDDRWPRWPARSAGVRRPRRGGVWRLVPSWRMVLGAGVAAVVLSVGALVAGYLLVEIPEPKSAAAAQANVYLYADGSQIAAVGEVNRANVPLEEVPEPVRYAVLAAEDRDFFDASPVDLSAMVRAGWNMLRGGGRQSGSTITQQYVKNYYLDQRQTVSRKVKELFIAVKLGRELSKEEILQGYLNTSYFGRNAYGVQAAAQAYYGKDVGELGVAEGAYLAALLQAPSAYDVVADPGSAGRAVARWEYVLDGMVSQGWLAPAEREALEFPRPGPYEPPDLLSGERGYLVEAVRGELTARGVLEEDELAAGGYRITTTIDPVRQEALTRAVEEQVLDGLGSAPPDSYLRVGATSVEVASGEVVAMYGGRDYTEQFVNNATRRDYQAASTFKPIVYAAALEHGAETVDGERIGPDTVYDGSSGRPVVGRDGTDTGWAPENEGGRDYGPLTVAEAMDRSVNAVFAQLGEDVGADRVRETAVALGIPEEVPGLAEARGSISLGTATPSTVDVAQVYAALARQGVFREAVLVREVSRDGEVVPLPEPAERRAVSAGVAQEVTAVLRGVVESGTGTAAGSAGRPAAGKTGTAEEDRAAWFAGFTPELATVVAVFGQDSETGEQQSLYGAAGQERISGGGFPALIWGQYTAAALHGLPVADFGGAAERVSPDGEDGGGEEAGEGEGADSGGTEGGGRSGEVSPSPSGPPESSEPSEPSSPVPSSGSAEPSSGPVPSAPPGEGEPPVAPSREPSPPREGADVPADGF
ncbi:transglycosylase domain-containing protein [Streptomyces harbinensis]|uniref:transglycosylase domain-containing protein n=2 Tax=Streptomyces TaxID=1883 RepID=UPI003399067F